MADLPLPSKDAGHKVFRVAREPDAWAWVDWSYAEADGTFKNRWDDPHGEYRVLYSCTQRTGAFVETLARFRRDPQMEGGMDAIVADDDDEVPFPPAMVPRTWADGRQLGIGLLKGDYADVAHEDSIVWLSKQLKGELESYGLKRIGPQTMQTSDRRFTQHVSRLIYELTAGKRTYVGIFYRSRLGEQFENWALYERLLVDGFTPLTSLDRGTIDFDDPSFVEALEYLELQLEA